MSRASPVSDVSRISALDGLRGWAALSVIVYHLTWELFGARYPIYRSVLISVFGNGAFAVAVFFAISGYVLTIARWNRADNPPLLVTLLRRYLRLDIPILGVVIMTFILMRLDLTPTVAASEIVGNQGWLGGFANFAPDVLSGLRYAFFTVFIRPRTYNYVPFLWTMMVELWGSLLVLTLSQWSPRWAVSYVVLAATAIALYFVFPQGITFPLGAIVALAQRDGWLFARAPGRVESAVSTVGAVATVIVAAYVQVGTSWQVPDLIAGFVLFVFVLRSMPVRALLSTPFSQFLGRLSFPLYLVQYAVIISLGAWVIVVLDQAGWLTEWTALGAMVGTGIVIGIAAALYLPVEILTLNLIRRIGRKRVAATAGTAGSSPQP